MYDTREKPNRSLLTKFKVHYNVFSSHYKKLKAIIVLALFRHFVALCWTTGELQLQTTYRVGGLLVVVFTVQ